MSDPRFARLKTDPRFRRPRKHQNKVVIDERFKGVFDDGKKKEKGGKGARVDKYGRSVSITREKDDLRRFYRLEEDEDDAEGQDDAPTRIDYARGEVLLESSDEEAVEHESDDDGVVTLGQDRARLINVADEDLEVELDENEFADLDAQATAAKAQQDAEEASKEDVEPTRRLAVVNMDWDHVRATHLFKIFSSVIGATASGSKPSKKASSSVSLGRIISVKVYPSQFGKERMAREEVEGPPVEVFLKKRELEGDEINETTIYEVGEEGQVDEDALRKYQLDRMRYYYAIVEFDSDRTASRVFEELEGTELERSANVFDLSYVPDDMAFDDEPRDEAINEASTYKGLDFVTDALRHSKVKLRWDEDDPERNRVTRRALTKKEIEEEDFGALIASSESSDSDDEAGGKAAARERMRALLLGGDDADQLPEGWGDAKASKVDADEVDMEITFTPGLSEQKNDDDETTLEKYQRKMREKRRQRKEEHTQRTKEKEKTGENEQKEAVDEFFGSASEEEAAIKPKKGRKSKKDKETKVVPQARTVSTAEELALLAASDNAGGETKHFDMKSIVKADKKSRKGKKGKKQASDHADELQEDFAINVNDERFKALHEDYSFAIDPSNPHFKKTKSMNALLDERAKRRKRDDRTLDTDVGGRTDTKSANTTTQTLDKLVESVKRKSLANSQGAPTGKRRRT